MSKINVHVGLKLPIDNVQYSNVELSVDFESESDKPVAEALIVLEPTIRAWVDSKTNEVSGLFKSLLELQAEKLRKGREAYIVLLEEKKKLETELLSAKEELSLLKK